MELIDTIIKEAKWIGKIAVAENESAFRNVIKWLQKKFPKQKFTVEERKTGDAIWETTVEFGDKRLMGYRKSGRDEIKWKGDTGQKHEVLFWGQNRFGADKLYGHSKKPIKERAILAELKRTIKESPEWGASWRKKGADKKVLIEMDKAFKNAVYNIKILAKGIATDLSTSGRSLSDTGGGVLKLVYKNGNEDKVLLEASYSKDKSKSYISVFNEKKYVTTPARFISILLKIKPLFMRGLKTISKDEKDMILGKITQDIVKGVTKVKATFDTTDEWLNTNLVVNIRLKTKKPVPKKILIDWLRNNWHNVQSKAPDKSQVWKGESGYEQPENGLPWLNPKRISWNDLDDYNFDQNGSMITVTAYASTR